MGLLRVKELATRQGIENPYQLEKKTGLSYSQCWKLWHTDVAQFHADTLKKLARGLNVPIGDLFRSDDLTD
jgi:DNA-binding Xre family transcriptional regulator